LTGEVGFICKSFYDNISYELMFKRKITVITGDSGIGKTDLIRLLGIKNKEKLRIAVICDYPVRVLTNEAFEIFRPDVGKLMSEFKNHDSKEYLDAVRNLLKRYDNCLFFADENFDYLNSREFSTFCKFTDSYYVLISRSPLPSLLHDDREAYTFIQTKRVNVLHPLFDVSL